MLRSVSVKMGIKEGMRTIFINAPDEALAAMRLPPLDIAAELSGMFDYIHVFVKRRAELEKVIPELKSHLAPKGKLWVSWPKNGGLGTDLRLTSGVIPVGYYNGLVESVCLSIDSTWSSLRFTRPIPGKKYNNSHAVLRLDTES